MRYTIYLLFFASSLIINSCSEHQEESMVKYNKIIPKHTEIKEIFSEEVGDTFYVYIKLPKNYESSNKRYPVLYLLDGDIAFNMASSIIRYLQYGNDLPEIIIVAPGYATMLSDNELNQRERDYTPTVIEELPSSGGGKKYNRFLKNELLPFIDSTYRTTNFRVLNGYSLGGLFVINTIIDSPEMFNGYIAGSPYLHYDQNMLLEKITHLAPSDENKNLFISVGETEYKTQYYNPIKSIFNKLKERQNISIIFTEFKNGTHFTCPAEALTYGLRFIFKDKDILEP